MKNKLLFYFIVVALSALVIISSSVNTKAQDTVKRLAYGDSVQGEITNTAFEVSYKFSGEKDDVIIIRMAQTSFTGGLDSPEILLSDATGKVIADTTKAISFGTAILPVELGLKGDYTIIATRRDGRAGKSVGGFALDVIKLTLLEFTHPINGKVSNGIFEKLPTVENFYQVKAEGPIKLTYQKTSGKYTPAVSLNIIKENELSEIGVISGLELTNGAIGIVGKPNTTYIVKIGAALLSFSEGEAEYTLSLAVDK